MLDQVKSVQQEYRGFNRLIGDATVNILAHRLRRHLSRRFRFVARAWVKGCPNEFDLLVVGRNAKPIGPTSAYRREDVYAIVEVKTSGSRDILSKFSNKLRTFKQIGKRLGKRVLYLSLLHTPRYAKQAVRILGSDAFILQIRRKTAEVNEGDWRRLVKQIKSVR
jgi:hypothetical protein